MAPASATSRMPIKNDGRGMGPAERATQSGPGGCRAGWGVE